MSILFNKYISKSERDAQIENMRIDIEFDKLNLLYEVAEANNKINYVSADLKVITEDGNFDDLMCLYTEADDENNKTKQNIFKRMIDTIRRFNDKIKNEISARFSKEKEIPILVKIDKCYKKMFNNIQAVWGNIKAPISKLKNGQYEGVSTGAVTLDFAPLVAAFAATATTGTLIVMKRNEIKNHFDFIKNDILDSLNNAVNAIEEKINNGNGDHQILKKILTGIKDVLKAINTRFSKIKNIFTKGGNKDTIDVKNTTEDDKNSGNKTDDGSFSGGITKRYNEP